MQTFTITDPRDRENPIAELSTVDFLMYHGTLSVFCPLIEQQGFCFDGFDAAYGEAVRTIVAACNDLDVKLDGYAAAKGFSDENWVYFTASFRLARGYARNVGGERIYGALRAAKEFLAVARDKHAVELRVSHWERVLKQHRPHWVAERVLANLRSTDLVRKLAQQVENAHSVLNLATTQGHPVVYAVRADQKWIHGAEAVATEDCHREPFGGIREKAVSADRIVARIEYPNSISPDSE